MNFRKLLSATFLSLSLIGTSAFAAISSPLDHEMNKSHMGSYEIVRKSAPTKKGCSNKASHPMKQFYKADNAKKSDLKGPSVASKSDHVMNSSLLGE